MYLKSNSRIPLSNQKTKKMEILKTLKSESEHNRILFVLSKNTTSVQRLHLVK